MYDGRAVSTLSAFCLWVQSLGVAEGREEEGEAGEAMGVEVEVADTSSCLSQSELTHASMLLPDAATVHLRFNKL